MKPQTLSTETIFKGRVFDIRIDTIRERDIEHKREIVVHQGSAVIVPLFDDGTVALVRQYRHAAGGYQLEQPAGGIEPGESFVQAAARELEEEIGFRAGKIEKLTEFYVSPGFLTEKMYVYLATELTASVRNLDDDEIVEVVRVPLAEALKMIPDGRIEDAKTIVGPVGDLQQGLVAGGMAAQVVDAPEIIHRQTAARPARNSAGRGRSRGSAGRSAGAGWAGR